MGNVAARRISFVNCKGGVGKTTLTVNVAAALVKYMQRKVLVVDLDAQSNASIWLSGLEHWTLLDGMPEKTVCAFFKDGTLSGAVKSSVLRDGEGLQVLKGLDLIPSIYDLLDLDLHVAPNSSLPYYQMFWYQMQPLFAEYDYVLFDCPPSMARATQCGIYASQEIYVPCTPDLLSNVGLRLLHEKICQFAVQSAEHRQMVRGQGHRLAKLRGIVLNYYTDRVNSTTAVHAMKERLGDLRGKAHVAQDAGILPPKIREAVATDRSAERALPVVLSSPTSGIAEDFEKLARWIDQHP